MKGLVLCQCKHIAVTLLQCHSVTVTLVTLDMEKVKVSSLIILDSTWQFEANQHCLLMKGLVLNCQCQHIAVTVTLNMEKVNVSDHL